MLKPLTTQMCASLSLVKFSSHDEKFSQQRNKEAKKSLETDKQRTLNIKEAGTIGKRLFPCFRKNGPPRPRPLERSYLVFQIRSRLVFGGLGLPTECCEEDGLPDVARCYFHLSVHPGHEAASTTQLLTPTPPSPA